MYACTQLGGKPRGGLRTAYVVVLCSCSCPLATSHYNSVSLIFVAPPVSGGCSKWKCTRYVIDRLKWRMTCVISNCCCSSRAYNRSRPPAAVRFAWAAGCPIKACRSKQDRRTPLSALGLQYVHPNNELIAPSFLKRSHHYSVVYTMVCSQRRRRDPGAEEAGVQPPGEYNGRRALAQATLTPTICPH